MRSIVTQPLKLLLRFFSSSFTKQNVYVKGVQPKTVTDKYIIIITHHYVVLPSFFREAN